MRTRLLAYVSSAALLFAEAAPPLQAQTPPPPAAAAATDEAQGYSAEQLDALLAPVALYPDALLAQTLMAATFPLQVVDAARWVEVPANKALQGDALAQALASESWDPSVKSLVPFPQVLAMMNAQLDWMQQVGYAMAVQQAAVMDSVQRLRRQAQATGSLQSTPQQVVRTEQQVIYVEPASPNVVYVPSYNPTAVYGAWPYPAYPPVYLPPPPGYVVGTALVAGLAFGAGVAIAGGLWGWARPNWGYGNVNVNVNRYNNINVHRPPINNANWRTGGAGSVRPAGSGPIRPPAGPVGGPGRPSGLPANAVGRPSVSVPGSAVRPAQAGGRPGGGGQIGSAGANRPQAGTPPARPGGGGQIGSAGANRPQAGTPPARPGGGGGGQQNRVAQAGRNPGAFSGMSEGRSAGQFSNRGAQSRQMQAPGGRAPGGGGRAAGGGGGGGRGGRR